MTEFEKWESYFRNQNLYAFNNNPVGLLWLKVRAISRGKQIKQFASENGITLESNKISEQNVELFNTLRSRYDANHILDAYLRAMNHEWYVQMGVNIDKLKEELYNVHAYSWGGDQNNSLDKHLISRYVKVISDFTELKGKQLEIGENAWNYVQNSWYNNWTSFIIESLFKRNTRVVSAVGEIKSVDFFIDDFPIDLKVTFFPKQFLGAKQKDALGQNELSWLKSKCKALGISADRDSSNSQQLYVLKEKLLEVGRKDIVDELHAVGSKIIRDAQDNPRELMRWLYENQGEMRFGAENRIYLILADLDDYNQSWKMKRAFALIEPIIDKYLSSFTSSSLKKIEFQYGKNNFCALADAIFVVK